MKERPQEPALTRRRFVAMVAAGSAALVTAPLAAAGAATAPAARPAHPAGAAAATMTVADRREFDRQRKAALDTLAVIRKHAMGPGTEMASVFRPLRSARRSG